MSKHNDARTVPADEAVARGRFAKARQFLQVADDARALSEDEDVADAAVTLYVHAGIAAADAICARTLGRHAKGQNHQDAVRLLERIDKQAAKSLDALLRMKTRAGYGYDPVSGEHLRKAERSAHALVNRGSM